MGADRFCWTTDLGVSMGTLMPDLQDGDRTSRFYISAHVYSGPAYHFEPSAGTYVGIGTGVRTGFANFRYEGSGAPLFEFGLRMPVSVTHYLRPDLALVGVLGAGLNRTLALYPDFEDYTFIGYDASFGVRWP